MRAGARRHRLTIQRQVPGIGFSDPTWTTHTEAWGSIEPLRGSEFLAADQVNSEVTAKITIPYRIGVTAAMRVTCNGRLYQIVAPPIDPDLRHRELQLMVREEVPS